MHVLRNVIAFGCFAGLAAVNGCSSQPGSQGAGQEPQAAGEPVGEAQQEWGTKVSVDLCNFAPALNSVASALTVGQFNCGEQVCVNINDNDCCETAWNGRCVMESLAFCRTAFNGAVGSNCHCPHPVCTVGDRLDYGCFGSSTAFKQCPALVCDQIPSCCTSQWEQKCIDKANELCNPSCNGDFGGPPGLGQNGTGGGGSGPGNGDGNGDGDGHGHGWGHDH